ncbi:serine/threonine protein kinase [Prauserella sp. PE36]|uniref:serine/threonine-protein kinase n=1 Tax=Prauserella sp. PE36 TaxID=1504709 RepID=UPI000DE448AF|nr:serine/threonine-protein kinase [Prauserella sp. PE36]RBM22214.1 serine/threonine protein kinase [Prauserella sp. PE36]
MSDDDRRLVAGRYRLAERLGAGAMGEVWKGEDERLNRTVALKQLHLRTALDAAGAGDLRARAMREGRIAARLMHPNAIAIFDVVEEEGYPWLVMEYLPSTSLADLLAARGSLPPAEVAEIGRQVAEALAAAHRSGIIHRDVKPANVLLADNGVAKISDFGISRAAGDVTLTATGLVAGTPAYFAPEVARGSDADERSDVFSLGSTLYHAVEGNPPFGRHDNAIALLHRVSQGEIDPPRHAGPLTPVLLRLLDPDPDARPGMTEAGQALAAVATASPATPATAPEPGRRRLAVVGLAALIVVAVLGAGLWLLLGGGDDQRAGGDTPQPDPSAPASSAPRGPTTSAEATTTPASPPPSTSSPTPTPTPQGNPDEQRMAAVRDYYALLPGNLEAAYARLSDRFKSTRSPSFADYASFWNQMSSVQATNLSPAGGNAVTATITYTYADGGTTTERHTYTLVDQNGQWAIDGQAS